MRFEKGHKEGTRRRIIDVASKRFRRSGFSASGLASIMADAGLTNGAFYPHFRSKDELFCEALKNALSEQRIMLEDDGQAGKSLEDSVRRYLNTSHLEEADEGCPSAALLPEIGRHAQETRKAYEVELLAFVETLARRMSGGAGAGPERRRRAMAVFGLLVGTLQIARAVDDKALAKRILEGGVEAALMLGTVKEQPKGARSRQTSG
jgi:TetR/AcrR family transcriptional regulator, transcriptional repressor for nem operon